MSKPTKQLHPKEIKTGPREKGLQFQPKTGSKRRLYATIEVDLYALLLQQAEASNRSVNAQLVAILEAELRQDSQVTPRVRCASCRGTNVEVAHWVNPNTDEVGEMFGSWGEQDSRFCSDCDGNEPMELCDQ